ncbi:DUF6527 family protein [Duganella fentianensis]|uniref:DUF6527 family protein n=1 Tax=Duganella fentianensis TaxID=2692177 RepID=UPI0032B25E1C
MKIKTLRPEYVKHVPEALNDGVLYISEEFETAGHLCCCGCGEEIFTPLNRAQWTLLKNRQTGTISLFPSIGNWKYACRSHYWIKNNLVIDAGDMSNKAINAVIKRDQRDRLALAKESNQRIAQTTAAVDSKPVEQRGVLARFLRRLRGS